MIKCICKTCKKEFYKFPSAIQHGEGKFCSQKCHYKSCKKRIKLICNFCQKEYYHYLSAKRKFCSRKCAVKGKKRTFNSVIRICEICNEKFRVQKHLLRKKRGIYCSRKCYTIAQETLSKYKGENHPSWKGGVAPLHQKGRGAWKYRKWKKAVLERDKFTCQKCNIQNDLIAHHVKGWTKYPKLRYIISNGLTVCHNCHWDIHRTMTTVPS